MSPRKRHSQLLQANWQPPGKQLPLPAVMFPLASPPLA
jgi:hypothetical protein